MTVKELKNLAESNPTLFEKPKSKARKADVMDTMKERVVAQAAALQESPVQFAAWAGLPDDLLKLLEL